MYRFNFSACFEILYFVRGDNKYSKSPKNIWTANLIFSPQFDQWVIYNAPLLTKFMLHTEHYALKPNKTFIKQFVDKYIL